MLANRSELVWALLVLVQYWIAQGRPQPTARRQRLGSCEARVEVIGGILTAAGVEGFLGNLDSFSAQADGEMAMWQALIKAWWAANEKEPVEVGRLFALATDKLPEVLGDGNERSQRIRLGRALKKRAKWGVVAFHRPRRAPQGQADRPGAEVPEACRGGGDQDSSAAA